MKNLLSIIIPVYNQEKYVERCLESIDKQLPQDNSVKIIIIDDGSTDNSKKIINDFIKNNDNYEYYYQKNGGVSSARNLGMSKVNSKYVTFIDPDDYITDNYMQDVISNIKNKDIELLVFNVNYVNGKKIVSSNFKEGIIKVNNHDGLNKGLLLEWRDQIELSVWNKIFDFNIIKKYHLEFEIGYKIDEDTIFMEGYIEKIKAITVKNFIGYYYVTDIETSAIHNVFNYRVSYIMQDLKAFDRIAKENKYKILAKYKLSYYLRKYFCCIDNTSKKYSFKEGWSITKEYISADFLKENMKIVKSKELKTKYRIYYLFIKYHLTFPLYIFMYIINSRKRKVSSS